jgi:hypothetical protein
MSWWDRAYVVLGGLLVVVGILEWVFARRVHAFFHRRNRDKSRWVQDIRGWSLVNVRVSAAAMLLVGALFMFDSLNR